MNTAVVRHVRNGGVWTWTALAVVVFALVGLGFAASHSPASTQEEVGRQVSESLRCPTCAGESIADSNALLSDAMRQIVEAQVAQGKSPEQIRAWFAERYGDEVLLDPPRSGNGWLLWILPLGLTGVAVMVLSRRRTRWGPALTIAAIAAIAGTWVFVVEGHDRAPSADPAPPAAGEGGDAPASGSPGPDSTAGGPLAAAVLQDAVDAEPGDIDRRLALASALDAQGDTAGSAAAYAAVVRLRPMDPDIRYRYAFALVRDADEDGAIAVLEETLAFDDGHPASLLLLGSLIYEDRPARGEEVLVRFTELAPDHPAHDQVTDLLDGGGALPDTDAGPADDDARGPDAPHDDDPTGEKDE